MSYSYKLPTTPLIAHLIRVDKRLEDLEHMCESGGTRVFQDSAALKEWLKIPANEKSLVAGQKFLFIVKDIPDL